MAPQVRRQPARVQSPAQLQLWRAEVAATQETLSEVLGCSSRAVASWELGERPLPPLLGWALIAAEPHVKSLTAYRRRRDRAARKRREKLRQQRRSRARAAAKRAVMLEQMREHRAQLAAPKITPASADELVREMLVPPHLLREHPRPTHRPQKGHLQ